MIPTISIALILSATLDCFCALALIRHFRKRAEIRRRLFSMEEAA